MLNLKIGRKDWMNKGYLKRVKQNNKGYTLIEMVVVIAIIGILSVGG